MIFDLQKFGEGEGAPSETAGEPANTAPAESADEGNKADDVQAKIDAAVTAQLAKAQAKWEA